VVHPAFCLFLLKISIGGGLCKPTEFDIISGVIRYARSHNTSRCLSKLDSYETKKAG
jgi:hypothetical protein